MNQNKSRQKYFLPRSSLMAYKHACFSVVKTPKIYEACRDKRKWSSEGRFSYTKLSCQIISFLSDAKKNLEYVPWTYSIGCGFNGTNNSKIYLISEQQIHLPTLQPFSYYQFINISKSGEAKENDQ